MTEREQRSTTRALITIASIILIASGVYLVAGLGWTLVSLGFMGIIVL